MNKIVIVAICITVLFIVIGAIFTWAEKDFIYIFIFSLAGIGVFIIVMIINLALVSDAKNYQRYTQSLDEKLIVITSLDNQEEKTSTSIKRTIELINEYNFSLGEIKGKTQDLAPSYVSEYDDYSYLDYDYVNNKVIEKTEKENN